MEELTVPSSETYETFSARGAEATRRGDFERARAAYSRAADIAAQQGDSKGSDKAALNLAMVWIQLGDARKGEEGLREILLRTSDPRLAFSAAYNLASSLRKQGRFEKALGYARRAMERARALDAPELLAPVHNLLGNIFLQRSELDEALSAYRTALALWERQPGDTRYLRAILEENLGYCLLLRKEIEAGVARIRHALLLADEVQDRRCRTECLQDLCYGLLLRGEHEEAAAAGDAALEEAVAWGYRDLEENCHFLLGEIGTQTGDTARRDRHFERLQTVHPELPFLKDFLCAVDVTEIITLKR